MKPASRQQDLDSIRIWYKEKESDQAHAGSPAEFLLRYIYPKQAAREAHEKTARGTTEWLATLHALLKLAICDWKNVPFRKPSTQELEHPPLVTARKNGRVDEALLEDFLATADSEFLAELGVAACNQTLFTDQLQGLEKN